MAGQHSRNKNNIILGIYQVWMNMISRCYNPNNRRYLDYGGRGITVSDIWKHSYQEFQSWALRNNYSKGLTIDRRNNDGPYSPDNCRFVTQKVQANNRRTNHLITIFDETKTKMEWSQDSRCKVKKWAFINRIRRGWNPEDTLITEQLK